MILKVNSCISKCKHNKQRIVFKKQKSVKLVLKSLWIEWLTQFYKKWNKNKSMKTICLHVMRMKKNFVSGNLKNYVHASVKKTKKICVTSWNLKWMQKEKEKMMKKEISMSKLKCGELISKIMRKRKEESKKGLIRSIGTTNSFYFCRWTKKIRRKLNWWLRRKKRLTKLSSNRQMICLRISID